MRSRPSFCGRSNSEKRLGRPAWGTWGPSWGGLWTSPGAAPRDVSSPRWRETGCNEGVDEGYRFRVSGMYVGRIAACGGANSDSAIYGDAVRREADSQNLIPQI